MDTPIGIDVEEKKRKTVKSILSLARRYFTPSEVDYLAKISDSDAQQKEFIKLWTLKEAYVKALGRGRIQISKAAKVCNDSASGCDYLSENWRFALAELNSSYYMSVCIEDNSRGFENDSVPLGLKSSSPDDNMDLMSDIVHLGNGKTWEQRLHQIHTSLISSQLANILLPKE
ncbi:hypothetical protein GUJ93_ZPchr0008g11604 [Zizania palustris]|uniref:4'-phosphopantetheinyl transferase domain-containing protein n=1 Tax=Zizania palustris TaxID=103762 RepID=A0A8J5RJ84_ZIZPA|nr:hypothetical protein GUJ93_ZPchr0008g11604 [Zizania palustris]